MNKKGFTLIELLAVIVILAIIALIAMPIILNVIETARKGSKESSVLGFVDSVEKKIMLSQIDTSAGIISAGTYSVEQLKNLKVEVKGEMPDNTSIVVINSKGAVEEAWFTYDNGKYKVYYNGKAAVANTDDYKDDKGNKHNDIPEAGSIAKTYSVGEAIYLDPTNLSASCNASNSVSTPGTKSGCMKFYIYDDSGDSYKMILDHNTTAKVAYETSGTYKEYSQASIKAQVDSDTTGWVGNPRLITANEIASITGNTGWDSATTPYSQWFYLDSNNKTQTATSAGASRYAWLFDYTNNCTSFGCNIADSSTDGYWTSSSVSGGDGLFNTWLVYSDGYLTYDGVGYGTFYGVRPVITLLKSQISS